MATKNGFNKIKLWEPDKLMGLARKYKGVYEQRVFDHGKDYQGKQFPAYSTSYKRLLNKDYRKKDGGRYKGFEGRSLTTGGVKISKRPPELTQDVRNNLKVGKVGTDYFQLQFTGKSGAIVDALSKKGRDFVEDVPNNEKDYILRELGKLVDKQYKKIPNVIVVGRK